MTEHPAPGGSSRKSWGPFAYVLSIAIGWLFMAVVAVRDLSLTGADIPGIAIFLALSVVSVRTMDLPTTGAANSFMTAILLACMVVYGPLVAGVIGLLVPQIDTKYGRSIVPVFNGVMTGSMTLAGGLVFRLVGGGHVLPLGETGTPLLRHLGAPLLAADLAMFVVNVAVLGGMIAISGGNPRHVLAGSIRELVPLYLGYALVAFVFVLLWGPAGVGPLSAVLISAPLAIAHFVYVQYGDEVRAHERIVGMFARAGDGPDGRVAAHGARVDELCQLMAGQLGLTEHERRTLGYAAHLHDIAMKSVVRATDVQRGGTGPYTNVQALLPHPELAERIVAGIPFLHEAAPTIRSHHERMDGRGYPDGLVGEQIPLQARILAVADAFDALTTSRGERAALDTHGALAELQLSAGAQLDPRVLQALTVALRGRERPGHDDPLNEGSWLWDHHTLPAMSDVIADELSSGGAIAATAPNTPDAPPADDSSRAATSLGPDDDAAREHGSRSAAPRRARVRTVRTPQEPPGGAR